MGKYRLKFKDGVDITSEEKNIYNMNSSYIFLHTSTYLICIDSEYATCSEESIYFDSGVSMFSQSDIDILPSGLFKKVDIIEVKEQLYYIKLPHLTGEYLYINYDPQSKEVVIDAKYECAWIKTKFTRQEIEEKFPLYANNNFMVRVDDYEEKL